MIYKLQPDDEGNEGEDADSDNIANPSISGSLGNNVLFGFLVVFER